MIDEADSTKVHPEAMPYTYPNTRHTLGAMAVGLGGGSTADWPLQVRNGKSNPTLPEDAWLEIPAGFEKGKLTPRFVQPLPDVIFNDTRTLILQRIAIADWLAGKDADGLAKGLLAMPLVEDLPVQFKIIDELGELAGL
jgi:hypothetical protein